MIRSGAAPVAPAFPMSDDTDWVLVSFEKKMAKEEPLPKGTCPKCREHIGRGLHFHVKACDGSRKAG